MRAFLPVLLIATAVSAAVAPASAAGSSGHDLYVVPPDEVTMTAPPYQSPLGTVTYGERATLLEVRDGASAVDPGDPPTPVQPPFGRFVGLRLKLTNTGSQDSGVGIINVIGSDGKTYGGFDPTMPGCAQLATFPPRTLAPGQTITACDVYPVPKGVSVKAVTINIGFTNPSATGRWAIDARPPAHKLVYAALGDSYSSGEGSGDYDKTLPDCHRGADAWPRLVARDLPGLLTMPAGGLLACSGADSEALLGNETYKGQPDQLGGLDRLKTRPTLLTVTVGGNDIGFADVLQTCFLYGCIKNRLLKQTAAKIKEEWGVLARDYADIRDADPGATLVVVGYPQLFPAHQDDVTHVCAKAWLDNQTRAGLNELDADLNDAVSEAAKYAHVRYLPVTNALAGHEACTKDSYIYFIGLPDLHYHYKRWFQQDGHPTAAGQRAIADLVIKKLFAADTK